MAVEVDEANAVRRSAGFSGPGGNGPGKVVSVDSPYEWNEGEWTLKGYQAGSST